MSTTAHGTQQQMAAHSAVAFPATSPTLRRRLWSWFWRVIMERKKREREGGKD